MELAQLAGVVASWAVGHMHTAVVASSWVVGHTAVVASWVVVASSSWVVGHIEQVEQQLPPVFAGKLE